MSMIELARRAVAALERIADAAEGRKAPDQLPAHTRGVTAKCGCQYDAEVDAEGLIVAGGVWVRRQLCGGEHTQGYEVGDTFRLGSGNRR